MTAPGPTPRPAPAFAAALAVHAVALAVIALAYQYASGTLHAADSYQSSVPALVASGKAGRAVKVTRVAVQRNALDLDAHHLLATSLLAAGREEAAYLAFNQIFQLGEVEEPDDPRRTRPSMRPFYHAPSRLALARHHFEHNRANAALGNAALALSFGQVHDDPGILRDILMEGGMAYTALQHSEISDDPRQNYVKVLRAWADGDWAAIRDWADEEGRMAPQLPLAHALAALGDGWGALGVIGEMPPGDNQDLHYVRGLAYEVAGSPAHAAYYYLQTPPESVYYPFALAKAALLERNHAVDVSGVREAAEALATSLNGEWEVPPPAFPSSPRLAGMRLRRLRGAADAPWQVLLCWDTGLHYSETPQIAFPVVIGADGRIAELRHLTPLNPFPLAMDGGPTDAPGPGWSWLTPWDGRQSGAGVTIENDDPCLRIYTNNPLASALVASPPVPVPNDSHFLLAVRCRSDGARLVAGWIWFDADENEVHRHNVLNQVEVPGWTWQAEYIERPAGAVYVQAVAGIYHDEGAALFSDLLILPMPLPDTAGWAGHE